MPNKAIEYISQGRETLLVQNRSWSSACSDIPKMIVVERQEMAIWNDKGEWGV
jgi:hypothetical protein